ncbi:hypothetical protein [Burkholderia vietnamiensis]|uniref:hypothetical protein n=1 Tax=Burkholderia vietnamiensis TaxID=60552 RepID=UPI001D13DEDE|nr:hypothetical protein [Burkholderia vietnamiensis]UEC05499.1 hypothetical protein LK462_35415 [Burkholderia vietnamiensis]
MFEGFAIINSSREADAWLRAVVAANGGPARVSYPDDCARIVQHFSRVGVSISAEEAASFWDAYSDSLQSGWIVLSRDCVAALDGLAEEIEKGWCMVERLQALKGTVSGEAG